MFNRDKKKISTKETVPVLVLSSERMFTYCFTNTSCSSLLQQVKTEVAILVPLALRLENK